MTITEKKPLLIRIPGEITPNELPISASAVGYDFIQGNYITYATGSDSWVTAPPNTAGIKEYWQSDSAGHIYTTGSVFVYETITGSNLILDDPASRILAPNGALVISSSAGTFITGSVYTQMLKVNGSITDGTITIPGAGGGFTLRGSAFLDDTDASGNSYGTVIRSQAGNLAYASLTFIQDNTYAGSLSALNNTPSPTTYGYRGGLNISAAEGKIINFRIAYPSILSVGNFNANGLEVTGSIKGSSTITAATGFSGSLTKLTGGTSYIIAGNGISVSSASNGAITISSSVSSVTPGGSDTYVQFNDAGIFGGVSELTFNKVTNTLTTTNLAVSNIATVSGSVILGDAASDVVYISGSVTASNGLTVTGASNFFGVKEKFNTKSAATGTVVHDCSTGHIFYHSGSTANWTSNFTNLSMSNGYATTITLFVTQSSNAYIPSAVQIEGAAQTLNWQGNTIPTGTASRRDVISFSILNVSSSYVVLGQFVSF